MSRPYYTLCLWNADNQSWEDECGHYNRDDCVADADAIGLPRNQMRILKTDGTSADMIAKRDALAPVKTK